MATAPLPAPAPAKPAGPSGSGGSGRSSPPTELDLESGCPSPTFDIESGRAESAPHSERYVQDLSSSHEGPPDREQMRGPPVMALPLSIQRAFRVKMLTVLLLQLLLTLGVGLAVRFLPPNGQGIEKLFPAQSGQALALMGAVVVSFFGLIFVKDTHPWNYLYTFAWSVGFGVFAAAAQVDGGFIRSNSLFVLLGMMAVGVFFLLLANALLPSTTDEASGEPALRSFRATGSIAYVFVVVVLVLFYVHYGDSAPSPLVEKPGHFVGAAIAGTLGFVWFCCESTALCKRMEPDGYMKGVVYYYADLCYIFLCCALLGAVGGGSSA